MNSTDRLKTILHTFRDKRTLRIVLNRRPKRGEATIHDLAWHHGSGSYPLDMLGVLIRELETLSTEERMSFNQGILFPGIPALKFSFAPGRPAFSIEDETPSPTRAKSTEELRDELRAAINRRFTPEKLADVFALLPVDAQQRVSSRFLAQPPARYVTRIIRRKQP